MKLFLISEIGYYKKEKDITIIADIVGISLFEEKMYDFLLDIIPEKDYDNVLKLIHNGELRIFKHEDCGLFSKTYTVGFPYPPEEFQDDLAQKLINDGVIKRRNIKDDSLIKP